MRPHRRHAILGGLALLACAGLAPVAEAQSGDEAAVAERVEALRRAMMDVDGAALDDLFADRLTYGHSDGRVQTKAEFTEALVKRASVFHAITLSDQTIAVSGDTAVVRHRFEADAVSGGRPIQPRIGVLQIWQRQNGPWRMLARQAYNLPTAAAR